MIGKARGARASLWSCGRPTASVCSVWFADCCRIVRRATRNRMMPPVMARTGKEISKFSNIVRPSKPAIARAPAEKRMALLARRALSWPSQPAVMLTKGTSILIGPSMRKSIKNIFRGPNSTSGRPAAFRGWARDCSAKLLAIITSMMVKPIECPVRRHFDFSNAPGLPFPQARSDMSVRMRFGHAVICQSPSLQSHGCADQFSTVAATQEVRQ